jgi:hypothetical protein
MSKKTEINSIELYFQWWLKEMTTAGYIKRFVREPETLIAAKTIEYGRLKRFKRKEKVVEKFNLFPEVKYTYDYIIIWNDASEYLFYEEINKENIFQFGKPLFIATKEHVLQQEEIVSYVDVKPTANAAFGGKVSSSISFPLKQRMCWENEGIYINKVIPRPMGGAGYKVALFVKSFVPQRYLLTDGGSMRRKISFPINDLKGYVTKKTEYINNLLKNTI